MKFKLAILVFALFMANQTGVLAKVHLPHLPAIHLPGSTSLKGYANPIGAGMTPWRVDQGVDYNGTGSRKLYALGSGTITLATTGSGWPGGGFVKLHLDSGRYKGRYVYYAEQINPVVWHGHVHAGQLIAKCRPVKWCVEVGWANPSTDNAMSSVNGQSAAGIAAGDPGAYPTGCGMAFDNLLKSLGAPGGQIVSGPVQGGSC